MIKQFVGVTYLSWTMVVASSFVASPQMVNNIYVVTLKDLSCNVLFISLMPVFDVNLYVIQKFLLIEMLCYNRGLFHISFLSLPKVYECFCIIILHL